MAITYNAGAVYISNNEHGHPISIVINQQVTSGAGGETLFYIPGTVGLNTQLAGMLQFAKRIRFKRIYVAAQPLTVPVKMDFALRDGRRYVGWLPTAYPTVGETMEIIADDIDREIVWKGLENSAIGLIAFTTDALTATDSFNVLIDLEVVT